MRKYAISEIDRMEGHDFEYFCADMLNQNGYTDSQVTPGSGDQGIDVIAYKEGIKYGIQCKCYSSDISNKAVQEAYSGKEFYNCHIGAVLTNRGFTSAAIELAKKNRILLWDRKKLIELMKAGDVFLPETEKAEYDRQFKEENARIEREKLEEARKKEEEIRQQQQKQKEAEQKRKAELEDRIMLEESRRDNIKKEYNKVSIWGGGSALGFIIILGISLIWGEKLADTFLSKLLIGLEIFLLIAVIILLVYSSNLKKEYEAADRNVKSLRK